jgi:3-methyladenine DNA glycosylase AlkD
VDADALADEIDSRIRDLPSQATESIRRVRRDYSRRLHGLSGEEILALADALVDRHRWVAYELLYHHPDGFAAIGVREVERLARGMDGWGSVDAFSRYISGPAWQRRLVPDTAVQGWAHSPSRWWRRAALVSTVGLNLRAAGGTGDTERTLDICSRLVADRDDMVVKAMSWALRELVVWDAGSVSRFLDEHGNQLAPRVVREVRSKLDTGLKTARGGKRSLRKAGS